MTYVLVARLRAPPGCPNPPAFATRRRAARRGCGSPPSGYRGSPSSSGSPGRINSVVAACEERAVQSLAPIAGLGAADCGRDFTGEARRRAWRSPAFLAQLGPGAPPTRRGKSGQSPISVDASMRFCEVCLSKDLVFLADDSRPKNTRPWNSNAVTAGFGRLLKIGLWPEFSEQRVGDRRVDPSASSRCSSPCSVASGSTTSLRATCSTGPPGRDVHHVGLRVRRPSPPRGARVGGSWRGRHGAPAHTVPRREIPAWRIRREDLRALLALARNSRERGAWSRRRAEPLDISRHDRSRASLSRRPTSPRR